MRVNTVRKVLVGVVAGLAAFGCEYDPADFATDELTKCGGQTATAGFGYFEGADPAAGASYVGTDGDDVIVITSGPVTVDAKGGDDLICVRSLTPHDRQASVKVLGGAGVDEIIVDEPVALRLECQAEITTGCDDDPRINQLQVIGSHNSYKQPVTPGVFEALLAFEPALAESLQYWHPPLADQFSSRGVRQIELDVFADPAGGHYAGRVLLDFLGLANVTPPELLEPGFKVLHAQEVDFNSHCLTFVLCLEQVEAWSDGNPWHLPIAILVELKTDPIVDPLDLGFVAPLPIGESELNALDAEILSVFDQSEIITPDDVRGSFETLPQAVAAGNWPTVSSSRGKVMFLMDNGGALRTTYLAGHPVLQGRPIFTSSSPGEPDAAFIKVNNPNGNEAYIQSLVADGYVVRTRSDTPTVQARSGDTAQREAALASGAQWVSTDYPVPGSSPFSDYFAAIPGGDPARCNPINTGPNCDSSLFEAGS